MRAGRAPPPPGGNPCPTCSQRRILPRPSMWPVTKCPPMLSPTRKARSRLTPHPGRQIANWSAASSPSSSANCSSFSFPRTRIFSTVRQQPLTARLSPALRPRPQTRACTHNSIAAAPGRMASTRPRFLDNSGEHISLRAPPARSIINRRRAGATRPRATDALSQPRRTLAPHRFGSVPPAQDHRSIKERDPLRQTLRQERRVGFAAPFHQQGRDLFPPQPPQQPPQVDSAALHRRREHPHFFAQRLHPPLRGRAGHHHDGRGRGRVGNNFRAQRRAGMRIQDDPPPRLVGAARPRAPLNWDHRAISY